MSKMVERVARALCRQYELDDGFSTEQADRAAASEMHRNFIGAARAAIEAMREPTEAMVVAGGEAVFNHTPKRALETSAAEAAWPAMIDACLGEPARKKPRG